MSRVDLAGLAAWVRWSGGVVDMKGREVARAVLVCPRQSTLCDDYTIMTERERTRVESNRVESSRVGGSYLWSTLGKKGVFGIMSPPSATADHEAERARKPIEVLQSYLQVRC
jgi:hypothetical protein